MSLYTKEVYDVFHRTPPHRGLKMYMADNGDHLRILVDADSFADFSEPQRQDLALWLNGILQTINNTLGVPCGVQTVRTK